MAMQFARKLLRIVLAEESGEQRFTATLKLGLGYRTIEYDVSDSGQARMTEEKREGK